MSGRFVNVDRDTSYLLPPSVQEWLPENHLARFVVEVVEQLNLSELSRGYRGRGSEAFPPSMMVALLFYGYASGVFSSRQLERSTYDSVAFRYVAANLHPDHDTIANFRKRFLKELSALFVQILGIAREMGVLKLGKVTLDHPTKCWDIQDSPVTTRVRGRKRWWDIQDSSVTTRGG